MTDPITTYILSFVTKNAIKIFEGYTSEKIEEIKGVLSTNISDYQKEEYEKNNKTKTILHRVEPVELEKFYLPLHLRKERSDKKTPTKQIIKLAKEGSCITIIGNAGSGKSTILKYLFINSIDTSFKIPIKIELRYLNSFEGSIIDYLNEKVFKLRKISAQDKIIDKLLDSGDFAIFLDGYDEISSAKKEKLTKEIDELTSIYNKNFYILTTRPYTEIDLLPKFVNYHVCELSDKEINDFIKKQISDTEIEIRDKLIEAVNDGDNSSLKSYLSNPLLLSMFILTFQSHASIPQKKSDFYAQVFEALYSLHDSMSKLAYVREIQSGLNKDQIIEVLKTFSFLSYFEEKFIFPKEYTNSRLNQIKSKKNVSFNNEKLMQDLLIAINIITYEGLDYSFPHRSMQEYFAAMYIKSLSEDNKSKIYQKISNTMDSQRLESKSNFLQILLEVDERAMIRECLIKHLEKIIREKTATAIKRMNTTEAIDTFINIYDFHQLFQSIVCPVKIFEIHNDFSNEFQKHYDNLLKKSEKDKVHKIEEFKIRDIARDMLVEKNIKPTLITQVPKLEKTIKILQEKIINENNNDAELIDMI